MNDFIERRMEIKKRQQTTESDDDDDEECLCLQVYVLCTFLSVCLCDLAASVLVDKHENSFWCFFQSLRVSLFLLSFSAALALA